MGYRWTGITQRADRARAGTDILVRFTSWERTMGFLKVELTADGFTQAPQRAQQYGLTSQRTQQLEGGQAPTSTERAAIRAYARTQRWRWP